MFFGFRQLNWRQFQNLVPEHAVKVGKIQRCIGVNSFPQLLTSKPQFHAQDTFGLAIKFQPQPRTAPTDFFVPLKQ